MKQIQQQKQRRSTRTAADDENQHAECDKRTAAILKRLEEQ